MKVFVSLLASAVLLTLGGCNIQGIPGSGVSATQERTVEEFQRVAFSGVGTAKIRVGGSQSVNITTDDNLIDLVETEVKEGTLYIRPTEAISPKVGLTIEVVASTLQGGSVSGAADMEIEGVAGDTLELSVSGAGELHASGTVRDLTVSISGAGGAKLRELEAENAAVTVSGAGDVEIFASKSLDAKVSGAGDIDFWGNPGQITKKISGAGDLTKKD